MTSTESFDAIYDTLMHGTSQNHLLYIVMDAVVFNFTGTYSSGWSAPGRKTQKTLTTTVQPTAVTCSPFRTISELKH